MSAPALTNTRRAGVCELKSINFHYRLGRDVILHHHHHLRNPIGYGIGNPAKSRVYGIKVYPEPQIVLPDSSRQTFVGLDRSYYTVYDLDDY
jgi:hypothetical protein